MKVIFLIVGLMLLLGIPIYLHALHNFFKLINESRPQWLKNKDSGSLSFMTPSGLGNPNMQWAVFSLAYSDKWRQLKDKEIHKYAKRIRVSFPILSACFLLIILGAVAKAY